MHSSAQKILDFGNAILNNKVFDMESDTMRPPNNSGFIVVECQTAPNGNKCVCVPRSWVQCDLRGKKVAIVYPAEDEIQITARIANNEPASGAWSHYIGEIKYEAESYEDAVVGYLEENSKQIEEKRCKTNEDATVGFLEKDEEKSCNKSYEDAVVGCQEEKVKQIEENTCKKSNEDAVDGFLEKNVKKTEDKTCRIEPEAILKDSLKLRIVLPKLNIKPDKKNKSLKKYLKEQSKDRIHKSKYNKDDDAKQELKENIPRKNKESTSDSGDSGVTEGSTRSEQKQNSLTNANTSEKSIETKIEDLIIESLQKSLKDIHINEGPEKSRRTISEYLDIEAGNDIDLSNSNLTPEDRQTVLTLQINQRNTRGYIKAVLIHIKTLYMKYIEEKKTLNSLLLKLKHQVPAAEVTEQTRLDQEQNSLSDDMETLRFDDDVSDDDEDRQTQEKGNTSMDTSTNEQNLLVEMNTQINNDSDLEAFIDDEESTLSSLPSRSSSPDSVKPKRQVKKNIFQEHSTWSLKHSKPGNGLVPFGGSNQVFINARGFEKAMQTSTDVKMLARLLSREIFRPEALRSCTMTGRRVFIGKNIEKTRRALHPVAVNDIIEYSMSYGIQMGWNDIDKNSVIRSLRSLLQNSRRASKKKNL